MKRIYIAVLGLLLLSQLQAQKAEERKLIWSVGEVELTRGESVQVRYPVMVAIDKATHSPQLGHSSIRFFYDAGQLSDLRIEQVQNNYQVSGLSQSKNVYGEVFGFAGGGGVFVQFNLAPNQEDLLGVSTEPVHLMDLTFTVLPGAKIPFCAPLILDNNPAGSAGGLAGDVGYLVNDGGISGTYYLHHKHNTIHLADDEAEQYLWERSLAFDNVVDQLSDRAGKIARQKSNGCLEPKLPVQTAELGDFQAWKEARKHVRLSWNTASEFNNDRFEVQRSTDGFRFQTIGAVKGQWNTLVESKYDFIDKEPYPGINYYRLVQIDNNGHTDYSSIEEVAFEAAANVLSADWKVAYYPNPGKGMVQLSSTEAFSGFEVNVYDSSGRFVLKMNDIHSGSRLDLSALSAGVYSVNLLDVNAKIIDSQQIVIIDK